MRKFISMFLIMAMLVGIVGTYPLTATANEGEVPDGTFRVEELMTISYNNVTKAQTSKGAKVTYASSAPSYARVETLNKYNLEEGVHIEVTDIGCDGDYSFAMYFGNMRNGFYDARGYMMFYENTGKFSVIATKAGGNLNNSPNALVPQTVAPLTGSLSIDIKVEGEDCKITVNDSSFTIPTQYKDETADLRDIEKPTEVLFNFSILDPISDGTYTAKSYPGATYTIESISSPQSIRKATGVQLASSRLMRKGVNSSLTATVLPASPYDNAVIWESSDTSIATVDPNGNVTGHAVGTVSITATSLSDPTKSAACEVTVSNLTKSGSGSVTMSDTTTGVTVSTPKESSWTRVHMETTRSMETGVNIEIGNITAATDTEEDYSIAVAIGNSSNQWTDQDGYILLCGESGKVAIVQSSKSSKAIIKDPIIDSGQIDARATSLSISIVKSEDNYILKVNDEELTIENGAELLNGTWSFGFGIMCDFQINGTAVSIAAGGSSNKRGGNVSFVLKGVDFQQKSISYKSTFSTFRSGAEMKAPTAPKGYVFAGWYSDEECETTPVSSDVKTLGAEEKVYARFVPEDVLRVEAQAKWTDKEQFGEKKIDLRFVTTVDSFNYQSVGFEVTNRADVPHKYLQQFVFASLRGADITYEPTYFNQLSIRFATINMTGITVEDEEADIRRDREIPVRAYWITKDGTTVYGPKRLVKISDAVENAN